MLTKDDIQVGTRVRLYNIVGNVEHGPGLGGNVTFTFDSVEWGMRVKGKNQVVKVTFKEVPGRVFNGHLTHGYVSEFISFNERPSLGYECQGKVG